MGIFKNLKNIFNKNIECDDSIDDRIVVRCKKKWLYLSKNIYVKEKIACVVVYKGKVCDVVYSGKYRINGDSVPETFGRAKIEKQTSKGFKIKRIRADVYFVNLEDFKGVDYKSNIPFKTKSNSFGKVKGCLSGKCSLKVLDAGSLIKYLIGYKGKIKNKEISEKLSLLIGNKINNLIQKNKILTDMLFNNQEYVENILNTDMQEALDKYGLFVYNVQIKAVDFSKKKQEQINEYLSSHGRIITNVNISSVLGQSNNDQKVTISIGNTSQSVQNHNTNNINNCLICSHCGKKNMPNSKICINCGKVLSK